MTAQLPLFSIIIPIYEVEPYLRKCLDSVINQTYCDWECICVDDGSPDNCGRILDEFKAAFHGPQRFEVIHRQNGGVSVARNTALDVATGEWVQFLDADDSLKEDFLERLSEDIRQHQDVDAIEHSAIYCYADGRVVIGSPKGVMPQEEILTGQDILSDPYGRKYTSLGRCSCYKIFRRSVIEYAHLRFTPGIPVGEDELFAAQFYAYAGKVAVCPKTAGYRRIFREGSALLSISFEKLVPKLKSLEVLYETYRQHPSPGLAIKLAAWVVMIAHLGHDQTPEIRSKCIDSILNSNFYNRKALPFLLMHGTHKARLFALAYLFSPRLIRIRILGHLKPYHSNLGCHSRLLEHKMHD